MFTNIHSNWQILNTHLRLSSDQNLDKYKYLVYDRKQKEYIYCQKIVMLAFLC